MSTDLATMFSGNLVPIEGLDDDTANLQYQLLQTL